MTPTNRVRRPAPEYLSAAVAAELLGVKVASLYSYVSRGVIRSFVTPGTRARRYLREDVESASKRMGGRAGIPDTMETAVRWGHPMLISSITEITEAGPMYRGRAALQLAADGRPFESVAELLWGGMDLPALTHWTIGHAEPSLAKDIHRNASSAGITSSARLMALVNSLVALSMAEKADFERGTTVTDARLFVSMYASAMGLLGPSRRMVPLVNGQSIAHTLAIGLLNAKGRALEAAAAKINAALIVCADHELSPATLAARVAASAGADLGACLQASIATHSGTRLGGACDRAEDLLSNVRTVEGLKRSIAALEEAGRTIPGFNLVAYPKGDPRARYLLTLAAQGEARMSDFKHFVELLSEVETSFELRPNISVGLVGLCLATGLPRHSAFALWIIGRCAGWVAHVIEQRQAGFMLRSRAKFVSPIEGPN